MRLNKDAQAKKYLLQAIKDNSSYVEAYLDLGVLEYRNGLNKQALEYFSHVLELDASNSVALRGIERIHLNIPAHRKAERLEMNPQANQ